jgi:hypothetical protein
MALDNFSNLKASIIQWSKRRDQAEFIDDYIAIAESEMYANEFEPLRIRPMEARATASADTASRFLELPEDFLEMRRLRISTGLGFTDVTFMAPEQLASQATSGYPRYFTVTTQLEFDRVPDSYYTVEMQYLKKLTALSDSNTSNQVLAEAPTIYLYGALWALFQNVMEMDLAEYYYGKFVNSIKGLNRQTKRGKYGPAPKIRIEGATP